MTAVALSPRVAWLDMADTGADVVYATTLPDGPPVVLRGSAGLIFASAAPGGSEDEVVERVAEAADVGTDVVRDDVLGFLDQLVSLGLLTRR
jgi:hypothetical protein